MSSTNFTYINPDDVPSIEVEFMGNGRLAVCIPTYQRSIVIQELLDKYLSFFETKGIDLYIFDSSEDDKTQRIVKFISQNFKNVFYVRFPENLHSNMKVYKIFQQYGLCKHYDYIWVCNDSIRWDKSVYDMLEEYMCGNYDMIVMNYRDREHIGTKIYKDKISFFVEVGWHLTLYGACLLKTDSMLCDVDWQYLQQKYNVPTRVNHSHVCFYFEKIKTMDDFSAIHISLDSSTLSSSSLKKVPGWFSDTFFIWGTCFPDAIKALPIDYDKYKEIVIRKNGLFGQVFDKNSFILMKQYGCLDLNVLNSYKNNWNEIITIPYDVIYKLASLSDADFNQIVEDELRKQMQDLMHFCKRFKKIYIYGAGKCAERYAGYLTGNKVDYDGFVVSSKNGNRDILCEHKVFLLDEIDLDQKTGLILGLNSKNASEVMKLFPDKDAKNIYNRYISVNTDDIFNTIASYSLSKDLFK